MVHSVVHMLTGHHFLIPGEISWALLYNYIFFTYKSILFSRNGDAYKAM